MRVITLAFVGFVCVLSVRAQAPLPVEKTPVVRYGVIANSEYYPQGTVKATLASVSKALENKRYEYLAAHLMDPAFIDQQVSARAKALEAEVERGLVARREDQKRNPQRYAGEEFLPATPAEFNERVAAEAKARAFQSVVKSIAETLSESPENVKAMAKLAQDGEVAESGATATVSHKALEGKRLYLKQEGGRWFVEDRQ
jgi:hypothetical protein